MNISPVLLLAIGSTFAILYGLIITIGWAVTRRNRRTYHNTLGYSKVELIDLNGLKPLGKSIRTVSLENNLFLSGNDNMIDLKNYNCFVVEITSPEYSKLQKGDLVLIDPLSNKIKYAFKMPHLNEYR